MRLFRGIIKRSSYLGLNLNLHIDDWIQQNIYFLNDYEQAELTFIQKQLQADDVFLDIGANIGLFSLIASQSITGNGKVIAFEASQKNYRRLQEHIRLNKAHNIETHQLAVTNDSKNITLYYDTAEANSGMVSAHNKTMNQHTEQVQGVALDAFLTEDRIDYIKLDIEGGEYEALLGMRKILEKHHPVLLMEIEEELIAQTNYTKEDMLVLLQNFGYEQYFVSDEGNLVSHNKNTSRKNYVFLAKKENKDND